VGSLAAAAAEYLLGCEDHLEASREVIQRERAWLDAALREMGLAPLKSSVNFILVNIESSGLASDDLAEKTMREGVLVRDCQSFDLGKSFIRVAVRSREENMRLIAALRKALSCRG
jgi:threonine-phosphate decarboxylase